MVMPRRAAAGPPLKTWARLKAVNNAYNDEIRQKTEEGSFIALHTAAIPVELVEAFDVVPIGGEWYSSIIGFQQDVSLLETAEHCGIPHESCAYTRACIGSAVANRGFLGNFPGVKVAIGQEGGCNMEAKWFEIVALYLNVPFFLIDVPTAQRGGDGIWGKEAAEDAVEYLVRQFRHYTELMESLTRRKVNERKFIDLVKRHNRNSALWDEVMKLWREVPSPLTIRSLFTYENLIVSLPCRPETTEVLQALTAELKERVAEGVSGVDNEQIRLCWNAQPAWYILSLLRFFEGEGATFVVSPYLEIWGNRARLEAFEGTPTAAVLEFQEPESVDDCLRETAKWLVSRHPRYPLETGTNLVLKLAREGKCDGVVWHANRGCKQATYGQMTQRMAVRQQLGLPTLMIEGSTADPRSFSETAAMRHTRIFLEQIRERKARDLSQ